MKLLRLLFAALFSAASAAEKQQKPPPKPPAEVMREMRLQWLTRQVPPDKAKPNRDELTAAVMDWPLGEQTVTVLASALGDASLYTTSTFGVIGGIGHEKAKKAALAFVQNAKQHLEVASPTNDYSYPSRQEIRFFFVTESGVRSVTFPAVEVQKRGSVACDLFEHAQQVVTELRLIADQKPKPK